MVKLAQHIEWSSPIPLRTGEVLTPAERRKGDRVVGERATSIERRKGDRVSANGKPRKTLAELFESRAASSSSSSASLLSSAPSSSSATATTSTTPISVRTGSSLSTSSSASSTTVSSAAAITPPPPPPPPKTPSSSSSSSTTPRPSAQTPSSSSTHAHVTFVENRSEKCHKHAHTSAAHQSSELTEGIRRSSSARKIADSSRHEGALLRSNGTAKRLSKSGPLGRTEPLPRSPLANASNAEPSHGISPAKPINRHNGRPSENLPTKRPIFGQEKVSPSSAATNVSNVEHRNRSPFPKFLIQEHNQNNFLLKSIDTVESLQNLSRFRQKETDPFFDRRLNVEPGVHGTPRKEKKVRKGLFGLLADSGTAKDSGGEAKGADASTWKFSGNLGKVANTQHAGGRVRDSKSPPVGPPVKVMSKIKHMDVEMQNNQHVGSKVSGLLGTSKECTESTTLTVEIPDKMVGLAWVGAEPRFLMPGAHAFPSDKFVLEQVVSDRTSYVKHGILHRVHIAEGHLGVAWVDGKAVLLEAGVSVHMCPSNKFSYITTDEKMLAEKEFVLGPFRVVTVDESEVGIKFCNRQPQILHSGRHCLSISKVEVFAGFESLLRRQSYVSEASAVSSDNMRVSADVWVEWQIKSEDAAAARLANVTDVEGALSSNVRRAFNLVIWEVNALDMKMQLTTGMGSITNSDSQPLLKSLSLNVCRECQDLFEEGWTVTIWDLQLKHIVIQAEVQNAEGND
ncbi:hypothetical protein GOP47_0017017 [Adiantum capillus-veneris]|uniref:Uncharacterized protein n=1 Tax=Adiantum capillus-veneris TaxID=13818 RepID=A0A9D4UJ53_ADICA|nr:hypothetical protein GOP47_0017017 [Adiantum capillus-veneris]